MVSIAYNGQSGNWHTEGDIALDAARDATVAAAWERHNAILGAKTQVIARYGPNANAVQALGLKKKSERRRPTRRMVATEA